MTAPTQWVAAQPLAALVLVRGGVSACLRNIPDSEAIRLERLFYRAVKAGRVKVTSADDLAVRLAGLTPMEIWGDDYLGEAS